MNFNDHLREIVAAVGADNCSIESCAGAANNSTQCCALFNVKLGD